MRGADSQSNAAYFFIPDGSPRKLYYRPSDSSPSAATFSWSGLLVCHAGTPPGALPCAYAALWGSQKFDAAYYWSAFQCEWATDTLFRPGALARLEPLLLRHGLLNFSSADILRFLGKRLSLAGSVPDGFTGEITTSLKRRVAGERLKHWIQGNSLKCYGKAHTPVGDVFRVETMTANAQVFRAYRPVEGGPEDELAWLDSLRHELSEQHWG